MWGHPIGWWDRWGLRSPDRVVGQVGGVVSRSSGRTTGCEVTRSSGVTGGVGSPDRVVGLRDLDRSDGTDRNRNGFLKSTEYGYFCPHPSHSLGRRQDTPGGTDGSPVLVSDSDLWYFLEIRNPTSSGRNILCPCKRT